MEATLNISCIRNGPTYAKNAYSRIPDKGMHKHLVKSKVYDQKKHNSTKKNEEIPVKYVKRYTTSAPIISNSRPFCIIFEVNTEYISIRHWYFPMKFLRKRSRRSLTKPWSLIVCLDTDDV